MSRSTLIGGIAAVAVAIPAFAAPLSSGLKPGDSVTPFHPKHVAGPLAGTTNCFPCTFQNRPQVQAWVNSDPKTAIAIASTLSKAIKSHEDKEFKGLVVFLTTPKNEKKMAETVSKAAKDPRVAGVGMALLRSDDDAVSHYAINTSSSVKNTVIAYKNWKVSETLVNLTGDAAGQKKLNNAIASITK